MASKTDPCTPWWTDEIVTSWEVSWRNRDLAELAPGIFGPAELDLTVQGWRGLDLALDVEATSDGYRCRSITLTRPGGVIDYGAMRLTPVEEVLRATCAALVMVGPYGGVFTWPIEHEGILEGMRESSASSKERRNAYAVTIHALARYAGLAARDVVVRALNIPVATATRIISSAQKDGTYPQPFDTPRPLRDSGATTEQLDALAMTYGGPSDSGRTGGGAQ